MADRVSSSSSNHIAQRHGKYGSAQVLSLPREYHVLCPYSYTTKRIPIHVLGFHLPSVVVYLPYLGRLQYIGSSSAMDSASGTPEVPRYFAPAPKLASRGRQSARQGSAARSVGGGRGGWDYVMLVQPCRAEEEMEKMLLLLLTQTGKLISEGQQLGGRVAQWPSLIPTQIYRRTQSDGERDVSSMYSL